MHAKTATTTNASLVGQETIHKQRETRIDMHVGTSGSFNETVNEKRRQRSTETQTHTHMQTHAFINNAIFCFWRSDAIGAHEHEGECRRPIAHSRVLTATSRVPIADCPQPSRTSCCCLRFSIPDAMQLAIRAQCVSQSLWVQRDGRRREQSSRVAAAA